MEINVAQTIYQQKYQEDIQLDQYLGYLNNGIELLKNNSLNNNDCSPKQMIEMNMALEYNMELMLAHLSL